MKFLIFASFVPGIAFAALNSVTVNTQGKIPVQRWLLDIHPPRAKLEIGDLKKGSFESELAQIKIAQAKPDFKKCWQLVQKILPKTKEIEPWVVLTSLQCGVNALDEDKSLAPQLEKELKRVQAKPEWIYQGPYAAPLRSQVVEGLIALANLELNNKRKRTWELLDQMFRWLQYMSAEQRATYYSLLGDLAFVEQKLAASLEYFKKSMAQKEDVQIQKKIDKLKAELKRASAKEKEESSEAPVVTTAVENQSLEARMQANFKAGNLGSVVEDATEFLKKYPEGKTSDAAAQRLLEILFLVLDEGDGKYQSLREKVINAMEACQSDRLGRWSKVLYGRGQYATAYKFAAIALSRLEGLVSTVDLMELTALTADHTGNTDEALRINRKIVDKFSGTSAAKDALFRLGLGSYRAKEYSQAIKYFETYIGAPSPADSAAGTSAPLRELNAMYWRVRSLQKLGKTEIAEAAALETMNKYPVSYYGIILRQEKSAGKFQFPFAAETPVHAEYWLIGEHERGWKRLQILLNAGWLDEAQQELKNLPGPTHTAVKLALVKYYASAMEYPPAIRWVTEGWDEDEKFRQKSLLRLVYPRDFFETIEQFSKNYSLDGELVLSLIRQESAFATKAVSRSNALGLMQLIPLTADEVAKDLSFKSLRIPDEVFNPKINIQMGSHYLAKMLRKFNGQVPLALAAYNAGPTRLDRWLVAKGLAKELLEKKNWTPDDDLWVDELPWGETSHYVKAILRNLVVYRSLKTEQPQNLAFPFWKSQE